MAQPVKCDYCGDDAEYVNSQAVYGQGRDYGMIYLCRPCEAYVSARESTGLPLGRLANKELRQAKKEAHAAFDPLWKAKMLNTEMKNKWHAKNKGNKWLAEKLGIPSKECDIGKFDVATCKRVVAICKPYSDRIKSKIEGEQNAY